MDGFIILDKIGEGSFSSVYKVKRKEDGIIYALKKVKFLKLKEKEKLNALNEIRILSSINSKNVISYKEAFFDEKDSTLNIIMEYADKGDLFQLITEYKNNKEHFEENEIWNTLIQLINGLKALHDLNILHRDLKSANVFLFSNGLCKLGDLNVSKVTRKGLGYTQTGTPYYASPEVWKNQHYDNKSDIWSLGCVIYEMAKLIPPFQAKNMDELYKKILRGFYPQIPSRYSDDLKEIIKMLIQTEVGARPTCDELLKMPLILKKGEIINKNLIELTNNNANENSKLLSTIRIPEKFSNFSRNLPNPKYYSPSPSGRNSIDKKLYNFEDSKKSNILNGNKNEINKNTFEEIKDEENLFKNKENKKINNNKNNGLFSPKIMKNNDLILSNQNKKIYKISLLSAPIKKSEINKAQLNYNENNCHICSLKYNFNNIKETIPNICYDCLKKEIIIQLYPIYISYIENSMDSINYDIAFKNNFNTFTKNEIIICDINISIENAIKELYNKNNKKLAKNEKDESFSLFKEIKSNFCLFCLNELSELIFQIPCGCSFCSIDHIKKYFHLKNKLKDNTNYVCICSHEYSINDIYALGIFFKKNKLFSLKFDAIDILNNFLSYQCSFCHISLDSIEFQKIKYKDLEENLKKNLIIDDYTKLKHYLCSDCFQNYYKNETFFCNICNVSHIYCPR